MTVHPLRLKLKVKKMNIEFPKDAEALCQGWLKLAKLFSREPVKSLRQPSNDDGHISHTCKIDKSRHRQTIFNYTLKNKAS